MSRLAPDQQIDIIEATFDVTRLRGDQLRFRECPLCGAADKAFVGAKRGKLLACCHLCRGDLFRFLIDSLHEETKVSIPTRKTTEGKSDAQRLDDIRRLWSDGLPLSGDDPGSKYLFDVRGLSSLRSEILQASEVFRYHPNLKTKTPEGWKAYPGLLCAFHGAGGELVNIRRFFLNLDGSKALGKESKRLMPGVAGSTGGCHRLYPNESGTLAIAEGVENALAVRILTGLPVWAAGDAHAMEKLQIPAEVGELLIFSDGDPAGIAAAETLVKNCQQRKQFDVLKLITPPVIADRRGDWNHLLGGSLL